jgi:hypothetical protein
VFVGFGKPEQFEIVAAEHDAVIGRALPDMAAARGRREAQPGPARARAFEIAHRDNYMIHTRQTVAHRPPSRTPARVYESGAPEAIAPCGQRVSRQGIVEWAEPGDSGGKPIILSRRRSTGFYETIKPRSGTSSTGCSAEEFT